MASNEEKYTNMSIPLDKMSDQQVFMLGIIMQEGALRMQEIIVEKLNEADSACAEWAVAIVESIDATTFTNVAGETK